jgi:hypothetical protein
VELESFFSDEPDESDFDDELSDDDPSDEDPSDELLAAPVFFLP